MLVDIDNATIVFAFFPRSKIDGHNLVRILIWVGYYDM